ncbi:MAG: class I SAM-dependent methyltransferase [Deltaproteobacteria bacterium]|nr:class I SAM-dependent methyltransferase [Deltaproteobacteria bacterium]
MCESTALELVVPILPSPIADAYVSEAEAQHAQPLHGLDLHLCLDCGHVQLLVVVDPRLLFGHYTYVTSVSLGLVEHFRRYADDVVAKARPAAGALVVEVGSNDGSLLRFFQGKGLRVAGVDPAEAIASNATAAGIPTRAAFFDSTVARELRAEHGSAALVCANNVFAHADGLADMCQGIRDLLCDDGVFVFEVAYLVDLIEKNLFDTVYHEHLCYHSVKPLAAFFRRHRMELVHVERIASKGGSIRGQAQLIGGPRPVDESVSRLIALEEGQGFDRPPLFHKFARRIESEKRALLALLDELQQQGKVVAGYGASATVTTLVHNFELGHRLAFLVDDNTVKHGLFMPACHLPVHHPRVLGEQKPDYVVILAWQYAEPIIQRNAAYLAAGGRFIVPLPHLRVI